MRIGMVSILFHRGQSEVTRTLRQALIDNGHEVFIFGRMGGVYGMEMQEKNDPYWKLPNVYYYPKYEIPAKALCLWAKSHKLDTVIFNEEYDFTLANTLQNAGIRTIQYVDFLHPGWADPLRLCYDQLWSASQRTTALLSDMGLGSLTSHIGWGVPDSMPYRGDEEPWYDFFHSAGWIGINYRKGTDLVLQATSMLVDAGHKPSIMIHAQVPRESIMDNEMIDKLGPYLYWHYATIPPPGLYHCARVVVQPSRMEGLGLTIVEGLYQGRTVITTDAPPMNEFVERQTDLVSYTTQKQRADGLSFPECTADVGQLSDKMRHALTSGHYVGDGQRNRQRALEIFDWAAFCGRIANGIKTLEAQ